jgi:putative ABC transport system substrate-binding protein
MRRRDFIAGIGGAIALWPPGRGAEEAWAQTPGRVYRLAHITSSKISETLSRELLLPALATLGFVEGRNLAFDARVGESEALPGLMRELLAAGPDVVVAIGPALAAAVASSAPVVCFGPDPVELGLARSYARPGGNVTGISIVASELEIKRLSILLEATPQRRRVAFLVDTKGGTVRAAGEAALRAAAAAQRVDLLVFPVASPAEYATAFAAMRTAGAESLLIGAAPEFFRDGGQLAALALDAGLPTVCEWAEMAQAGCLIGYGPNRTAMRKRMADQIAQIFRGVAPGDIAIERPTQFDFAFNQKVAKSLGVAIPPAFLAQADEVIE